jgi:2-keto-4-pentenoate hydratase/2-oxohepta-3-ene-1,7-dioic acid hydratase in catechol pathway
MQMQRFKQQGAWLVGLALLGATGGSAALAAAGTATVPFKLGTFHAAEKDYLGLVLQDSTVVDIAAANAAWERRNGAAPKLHIPTDMKDLIARYDDGLGARLRVLAQFASTTGSAKFARRVADVRILPPVRPALIFNAGANYPEHAQGIVAQAQREAAAAGAPQGAPAGAPGAGRPTAPQSAPGYWERPEGDTRPDNPYLFLKSPTAVVGADDDIVIPRGREEIDWECEFAVVIGHKAKNLDVKAAPDYVFGYSIEFDVSDRGGRGDRKMGGGPDWLVQKNHDTFAPIGPYIVPKEFMPDPRNVRHYFTLNGEIKQDSNTSRMEYNLWEMLAYASNMMTLSPGDMLSLGTPPGTNIEKQNPRWMRQGDNGVCVVEGVGEQHHRIVAQE